MNATDEAVTKLTSALEASIKQIGSLGEKYGPEVIDAGLAAVRITGLAPLIVGAVCLVVALTLFAWAPRSWAAGKKSGQKLSDDAFPAALVGGVMAYFFAGCFAIAAADRLLVLWNWVAVFEPKLWVAKRLLGL